MQHFLFSYCTYTHGMKALCFPNLSTTCLSIISQHLIAGLSWRKGVNAGLQPGMIHYPTAWQTPLLSDKLLERMEPRDRVKMRERGWARWAGEKLIGPLLGILAEEGWMRGEGGWGLDGWRMKKREDYCRWSCLTEKAKKNTLNKPETDIQRAGNGGSVLASRFD